MNIEKHDLHHEFPQHKERISELKISNRHFSRLFEEYHIVDREVHKIEEGAEAASDQRLELLKKRRMYLKDDLYNMLEIAAEI